MPVIKDNENGPEVFLQSINCAILVRNFSIETWSLKQNLTGFQNIEKELMWKHLIMFLIDSVFLGRKLGYFLTEWLYQWL